MDWERHGELSERWRRQGQEHADEVNAYVARGEAEGWDTLGPQPRDPRADMADAVMAIVLEANAADEAEPGSTVRLREMFPPAHEPFIPFFKRRGVPVGPVILHDAHRWSVVVGRRQPIVVRFDGERSRVFEGATCIGRSPDHKILAIAQPTKRGRPIIALYRFSRAERILPWDAKLGPPRTIIPFPDGARAVVVAQTGIYLVDEGGPALIHPEGGPDERERLPMAHAAMSPDGGTLIVGHQDGEHRVLDGDGRLIGVVGAQSEYPHYAAFSSDGSQAIFNSCHFYNGVTVGIDARRLRDSIVPAHIRKNDPRVTVVDDLCRVHSAVARVDEYILGDAYGYLYGVSTNGERRWRHALGSTVTGMDVTEDGRVLAVGCSSGLLHILDLDQGTRAPFTIATSTHHPRRSFAFWSGQPIALRW